ncbi:MAG: adenylylsulfate kinase [Defluviitaleaceae bacterium]|nr:adenylylsulfate kinase [Defluviitaleaceae bacterium]
MNKSQIILSNAIPWILPDESLVNLPTFDMPNTVVNPPHLKLANAIFPPLLPMLIDVLGKNKHERAVISVFGGSGTGKTGAGLLVAHFLQMLGVGAYAISGDHYPHRIPKYNDAERLNIFRKSGIKNLLSKGMYNEETRIQLTALQKKDLDADESQPFEWLPTYLQGGDDGLRAYLGTEHELDFTEISDIITQFKNGGDKIFLKRMGRESWETWYEETELSHTKVLIIEWTHGGNENLKAIDIPILLWSTPAETLASRLARQKDDGVDSPFVSRVLHIENELLYTQGRNAKLIISRNGERITYEQMKDDKS